MHSPDTTGKSISSREKILWLDSPKLCDFLNKKWKDVVFEKNMYKVECGKVGLNVRQWAEKGEFHVANKKRRLVPPVCGEGSHLFYTDVKILIL